MLNTRLTVKENVLTIVVDLSKEAGPSKTGKTIVVASTQGNQNVDGHPGYKVGLNVYKALPTA